MKRLVRVDAIQRSPIHSFGCPTLSTDGLVGSERVRAGLQLRFPFEGHRPGVRHPVHPGTGDRCLSALQACSLIATTVSATTQLPS